MTPYEEYIREVARRRGVPEPLALGMVEQESRFDPLAKSPAGAIGLTQLMPETAASRGVDPWNWRQNVEGGIGYLADQIQRFGSPELGLAAYNGGPARLAARQNDISRMPPETRNYVPAVMARAERYAAMPQASQSDPWEALDAEMTARFQGQAQQTPQQTDDPWASLDSEFAGKFAQTPAPPKPAPMNPLSAWQTMHMAGLKYLPTYLQNALTTTGMALTDLPLGAEQRASEAAQKLPGEFFAPLRETTARRAQEIESQMTADKDIRQQALDRPGGALGYIAGMTPPLAAASMIPGANTLPGAAGLGTIFGMLQPTAQGESATENAIKSGFWSMLGQGASNILSSYGRGVTSSAAKEAAEEASRNSVRDAVVQKAREAGLSLPASVTNPGSKTAGIVEGIAGKNTTAARMASLNQPKIDAMARRVLDAPADAPLTEALVQRKIATEYAKGYVPVKSAGQIVADQEMIQAVDDIVAPYKEMQASFPNSSAMPPGVQSLIDDLSLPQWDAAAIVTKVRQLRFDAKNNFKALGDPDKAALAVTQKRAALELENLIERNLQRQGKEGVLAQFRASRQKMAQAFDIDEALTPAGNVNAEVFGNKALKGEPLTGDLKTIGDAWALHRKGSMAVNPMSLGQSQPLITPLDVATMAGAAGTGGLGTLMTGNPLALLPSLLPLARPAMRAISTTPGYQRAIGTPSYGPGLLPRMAGDLLDNEIMPALLKGAGLFQALSSE